MNTSITFSIPPIRRQSEILTPEALGFLEYLHRGLSARRIELLEARHDVRARIAAGADPKPLTTTASIREDLSWRVAEAAPDLLDRRVELVGPAEPRHLLTALESGASTWVADFEDSMTPGWTRIIGGQALLRDAIHDRVLCGEDSSLTQLPEGHWPTIMLRPRGLHLPEKHLQVAGEPLSAGLVDVGLYLFHNARTLIERGSGPYFSLPKIENHQEAAWWNDLFNLAQDLLEIPRGTIRASILIETITAAFQMDEILFELRDHAAGLVAGRWDYIFSLIKTFRTRGPRFVLPERSALSVETPFLRAYSDLLVTTSHRRGTFAIAGMSAEVPSRRDPVQNSRATAAVRADATRFAVDGFDGTLVAHPDLVNAAREVFDAALGSRPNQIQRQRDDVKVNFAELIDLTGTQGEITEAGIRANVEIGIRYIESWLRGNGAVTIRRNMEDASTAEIARAQIWQWIHNQAITNEGEIITALWVQDIFEDVYTSLERFEGDRFRDARGLFEEVALAPLFPTFLTIPSYARFLTREAEGARESRFVAA